MNCQLLQRPADDPEVSPRVSFPSGQANKIQGVVATARAALRLSPDTSGGLTMAAKRAKHAHRERPLWPFVAFRPIEHRRTAAHEIEEFKFPYTSLNFA